MFSTCLRTQLSNLFRQGSKSIVRAQLNCLSVTQRHYAIPPSQAFLSQNVVPDVIPNPPPSEPIIVYFQDTGVYATQGNVLTPYQVRNQPDVKFSQLDSCALYTLCMTDPDAPSRKEPTFREWHHWLVVNIPGNNVRKGEVISSYIGSAPPMRTGMHRYVLLLYQQLGRIECNEPRLRSNSGVNRGGFSIKKFADKYDLGNPVAGNFFLAEYDDHVPYVFKQIGA